MIALVFALKFEASRTKKELRNSLVTTWTLNATGIQAAKTLAILISKNRPQIIVSAGLAGGLDDSCSLGTVVLGENYTSARFLERLVACPDLWRVGTIYTTSHVVDSHHEKRRIGIETGALCCDMETAHLWKVASDHEIPMLALRAVSDPVDWDLPMPGSVLFDPITSRPDILAIFMSLIRQPSRVPEFLRMRQAADRASQNLSRVLHQKILPVVINSLRS